MRFVGKLFAIEGQDGCGKATQVNKLAERLELLGYPVQRISFPRYGNKSARLIELYLQGIFGPPHQVDPYFASSFYIQDRFDASDLIKYFLMIRNVIIADRYSASNMAHQGGKIKDPKERGKFLNWLTNLEFERLKIPKPDLTIILSVPAEISFEAAKQRAIKEGRSQDGHEIDFEHIQSAAMVYKELTEIYPEEYKLVECMENGAWLAPDTINERIWSIIKPLL